MSSSTRTKLLLLVTGIGIIAVYAIAVLLSTTKDRVDQIDSKAVEDVAGPACVTLRTDLDALPALPAGASNGERSARVAEQAAVVDRFVTQVRTVGDAALDADSPTRTWLGDWRTLVQIRQDYALAGFQGTFAIPQDEGLPITQRMNDIGVSSCQVPQSLETAP